MLKVCHVISGLDVGGTERFLSRLLAGGMAQATSNLVISLSGTHALSSEIAATGARLELLRLEHRPEMRRGIGQAIAAVRTFRPDVVQGWMYHGNLAASLLQRFAGADSRIYWSIRQSLQDWPNTKPLTKAVIRLSAAASRLCHGIVYNAKQAQRDHEAIGFSRKQGIVIPNGLATSKLDRPDESAATRAELGISADEVLVAHIARHHPNKGQDLFVAAASKAIRLHGDLRFIMAGNGVDHAFPPATLPPELRGRFIVCGNQADPTMLMRASDIFALSSRSEAFPNALAEAMQAGCACVATDVGDVTYLLNGTGLTVAPGDSAAMACAMVELARDRALRQSLGARAAERIAQDFPLDRAVASFLDLYTRD